MKGLIIIRGLENLNGIVSGKLRPPPIEEIHLKGL